MSHPDLFAFIFVCTLAFILIGVTVHRAAVMGNQLKIIKKVKWLVANDPKIDHKTLSGLMCAAELLNGIINSNRELRHRLNVNQVSASLILRKVKGETNESSSTNV